MLEGLLESRALHEAAPEELGNEMKRAFWGPRVDAFDSH